MQTALFRAATTTRRLRSAFGLSAAVITTARGGLARAYPDEGDCDRALRFVALHYGVELAAALRVDLERRDRERPPAG